MSPAYRRRAHDLTHGRRVEPVDVSKAKPPKPGTRPCSRCGKWLPDPHRGHTSPDGISCREPRTVVLDEIPDVELPPEPKRAGPRPSRGHGGVRASGSCETCGRVVSGERRFCGLCMAKRPGNR